MSDLDEKQYKVMKTPDGSSMAFNSKTPDDLCHLLISLHHTRERVLLIYGDPATGYVWRSATPERGRIGRSCGGSRKIPLLVRTSRSMGGEAVFDDMILEVRQSVGGRVLYKRPGITLHHKKEESLPELPFTD